MGAGSHAEPEGRHRVLSSILIAVGFLLIGWSLASIATRAVVYFFMGVPVEVERYRDGELWHVSYVSDTYDSETANWDGTLSEWRDGYFIAHDWSRQGQAIANRYDYVEVDDVVYAYDGDALFEPGDDTVDVAEELGDTDGDVLFQTCEGDGYRVVRYIAVDNAQA